MEMMTWHDDYSGALASDRQTNLLSSELHGYHMRAGEPEIHLKAHGTYFGFVTEGIVRLSNPDIGSWTLRAGQWFSVPHGLDIENLALQGASRIMTLLCRDYIGLYAMGGPLEKQGRLRYIDGCTDSLLMCPPRLGDPCLNHLHFPKGIHQTMHHHPSARMGMVYRGHGICYTKSDSIPLRPGTIFYIPSGVYHNFATTEESMDVFAYHPDSDWGPEDEIHPMINRTWIHDKKINTAHSPLA